MAQCEYVYCTNFPDRAERESVHCVNKALKMIQINFFKLKTSRKRQNRDEVDVIVTLNIIRTASHQSLHKAYTYVIHSAVTNQTKIIEFFRGGGVKGPAADATDAPQP
jgi:hypothetical protein